MINHTTTTMNTSTLTSAVKALYTANTNVSVKEILNNIQTDHKYLIADYRKVYNTLKRISGGTSKTPKAVKTEKASIVLDLTQTPAGPAIPGVVVNSGKK